jgi:hypothetical protein
VEYTNNGLTGKRAGQARQLMKETYTDKELFQEIKDLGTLIGQKRILVDKCA